MTKEKFKEDILSYLRSEFEDDPEMSKQCVQDICLGLGLDNTLQMRQEVKSAADELFEEGLLNRFDSESIIREKFYQACGGKIIWDLEE